MTESEKIAQAIAAFPPTFGMRSRPGRVFRFSPVASFVNGTETWLVAQARQPNGAWQDATRGTVDEFRAQVVALEMVPPSKPTPTKPTL
jgi:hypothetical protein